MSDVRQQIRSHRDLMVWQKAMDLVTERCEMSDVRQQIRSHRDLIVWQKARIWLPRDVRCHVRRQTADQK